jgi:ABC-type multidrug transport system fused ATPase/permease subunit
VVVAQQRADAGTSGGVMRLYRALWQHTAGDRLTLLGALVLLVAAQLMLLALPYVSGRALNTLQLHGVDGLSTAGGWLAAALAVTAGSWILHGPGRILERNVALRLRERLSTGLVDRALQLPLGWHEAHHSGATAHRIQQSTHALAGFAQTQFVYISSFVRLVGPLAALWWLDAAVGAAALVGFVVICGSVIGFDRAMIRLARLENDAERRYAATLIDSLGNATSVLALRQGRSVLALLGRRLSAVFEPMRRSIVLNELKWCTVDTTGRALTCGLVALFAWRVAHGAGPGTGVGGGALPIGSIYMVWEYAAQAGGVISAVASHFQAFARMQADYSSADTIREAVPAQAAEPAAATATATATATAASIAWRRLGIRDLTFRHASARHERPTLDHVALTLERGKRYAIVGSSGSGKSTLLRVLAGLHAGERIVLGCDAGTTILSPAESARFLRGTATLIPQDAEVFEGTLGENLAMCEGVAGPPRAEALPRALDLACTTDFLPATLAGLETRIAERGANWSGGQRARVALARGILAAEGSSLVLLDEPTASLDPATEARVHASLFTAFADACLVSSVHRLHLLPLFDEVLVMSGGRLVAQVPPARLDACPEYADLQAQWRRESNAAMPTADPEPSSAAA